MKVLSLISLVVATSLPALAMAQDSLRRPAQSAARLPAPAAAGPLRILLVDDDFSDNNHHAGDSRQSPSDRVFRKLVEDAVGGNAKAWSIEHVKAYASGPGIERLRPFSVIVWYTGAIYGGNPDNSGVLSIEDEKTVRRYLQEVGGAVILFSPGYLSKVQGASGTWEKTDWKFLTEVVGLRGGVGLAQRFLPGTVTAPDGTRFNVDKGSAVESQFSLANPARATVLFSTVPASAKPGSAAAPVATSHAYGKGRFIYVGFSFENLAAAEHAPAFGKLLAATGLSRTAGPVAATPAATAPLAASVREAEPATVQVTGSPAAAEVRWTHQTATLTNAQLGGAQQTARSAQSKPAATQTPTAKVERLVPNAPPVRVTLASPDAIQARDSGPFTPGQAVTYRVTLTDAQGRAGYKEASFTPQAKDPESLTAAVQADGSVVLSWPEVPGVASYQISGTALAAPVTVHKATEWRSPTKAPGSQQWKVASVYEPGGVLTAPGAWPSASSRVVPAPGMLFLTLPNGSGSAAITEAYSRTYCPDPFAELSACSAARFIREATNWEQVWAERQEGPTNAEWTSVAFSDPLDLGVGRRVSCAPRKNGVTVCWATSHFAVPAHNPSGTLWPAPDSSAPGAPGGQANTPQALANRAAEFSDARSLSIIVMSDTKAFFGSWKFDGPIRTTVPGRYVGGTWTTSIEPWGPLDSEHIYAMGAQLQTATALDTQGRKGVPHACLSCHGGTYNPATKLVTGASLLPLVPSRLTFPFSRGRSGAEEPIRRINQIVLQSNPAPGVVDQIQTMYGGVPGRAGATANDAAVPAGWNQQAGLYRQVVEPYCASCHFAQRGPFNFRSWGNLLLHKSAVQRTVCSDFTMPHSEIQFRKFWSEGGSVSLPGLLSTALGFQKCPQ